MVFARSTALILKLLQPNLSWAEAGVVQNCLSDTAGQLSAGCAVQWCGDERKLRRNSEPAAMQVVPVTLVECIHRVPGTQSVQTLPHTHTLGTHSVHHFPMDFSKTLVCKWLESQHWPAYVHTISWLSSFTVRSHFDDILSIKLIWFKFIAQMQFESYWLFLGGF